MKNMRNILFAAASAVGLATASQAATLNFVAEAHNAERGVEDNTVIMMDGVDVTFSATHTAGDGFAYFDNGAGLGVCKTVSDFSIGGTSNRCASGAGDDNVTEGETVTIAFDQAMNLSDISFKEEGHGPFSVLSKSLLFGLNGGALTRYTFGDLQNAMFSGVNSATFGYDVASVNSVFGSATFNPEQFYLASAVVNPVPVPASLPLLLAGLGGLGLMRRRRKAA